MTFCFTELLNSLDVPTCTYDTTPVRMKVVAIRAVPRFADDTCECSDGIFDAFV